MKTEWIRTTAVPNGMRNDKCDSFEGNTRLRGGQSTHGQLTTERVQIWAAARDASNLLDADAALILAAGELRGERARAHSSQLACSRQHRADAWSGHDGGQPQLGHARHGDELRQAKERID